MIPYRMKRTFLLVVLDVGIVLFSLYMALQLRFEWKVPPGYWVNLEKVLLPTVLLFIFFFAVWGFYRTSWRYASIDEIMLITLAVSSGVLGAYLYGSFSGLAFPRSVYIIIWFMLLFFLGGSRLSLRVFNSLTWRFNGNNNGFSLLNNHHGAKVNLLIYGAGDAGILVANELKKHGGNYHLLGYIDDDKAKHRQVIQGLPVLGGRDKLLQLAEEKKISEVVIAIPSASYAVVKGVVNLCLEAGVKVKTIPGIYEILEGKARFTKLKEVQIEDLLKRPPVKVDIRRIAGYLSGETVMITGCGGSIGSELCRQVVNLKPDRLILFERDENNLFLINRELEERTDDVELVPVVGDIQNLDRLEEVFSLYRPGVVFHAAAYKHVPMMENNINEAIKNNIYGTKNVADMADAFGAKRFVMVSTDKAVNPTSVMGATKRVAELYIQLLSKMSRTIFCAVRFGNVLDSRGSVVPLFREQIIKGGPVTVTHPEMVRFFMTIPEAVQLIIQSGAMAEKGEVFVLDMGEPVRIVDLARDMIMLSGLKPDQDIKIQFTGIRPGEKLFEELFTNRESFTRTSNERIFIARENGFNEDAFNKELNSLQKILGADFIFIQKKLNELPASGLEPVLTQQKRE
ncbi:MAG: polysaccharide biosynthesis protein [Firmicutes bacterium]|nr:polysaccharide biosynthesis protein [Bacillota bacterium]